MKTSILIIILLALIQTTIVPVNLVLVFIITLAISRVKISNYYIALFAGILLGLLANHNLGVYPIIFLLAIQFGHMLKYLPSSNFLLILPLTIILLVILKLLENWWLVMPNNYLLITTEAILMIITWVIWQGIDQRIYKESDIRLRVR